MNCEMCGASLEGRVKGTRFCTACKEERQRIQSRGYYRRKSSGTPVVRCCKMCGAEVPPKRWYCDSCKAALKSARNEKQNEECKAYTAPEKPKPIRPKDPLEGWSAVEIARLGRIWGLSYGYTVLKARDISPGALELLRKKVQRAAL